MQMLGYGIAGSLGSLTLNDEIPYCTVSVLCALCWRHRRACATARATQRCHKVCKVSYLSCLDSVPLSPMIAEQWPCTPCCLFSSGRALKS